MNASSNMSGRFRKVGALAAGILCAGMVLWAADPGCFFSHGPKDKNEIVLTFDDGPGPSTEKILDILKRYQVKATFFMEGSQVAARPQIARKVAEAGHEIGGHSYSHVNFYQSVNGDKEALLTKEIEKTAHLISNITGTPQHLMRMPHGYVRSWVKDVAKKENLVLVNWTFGCDWKKYAPDELARVYIENIKPGAVFLMHDGGGNRKSTVEALPAIIEEIQKRGYKLVTAGEMFGVPRQPASPMKMISDK